MEIDKVFSSDVDGVADNLFSAVKNSVSEIKAMQQRKAAENAQLVIQALKKLEANLENKFDGVATTLENRVSTIKDGRDGLDGRNGRDGKDGRPGRDGAPGARGPAGVPGTNGRDGEDGVSVTDARIDFDGSLIISLSSGREINVGDVVPPELAERIKVTMSTNASLTVQEEGSTLTSGARTINFTGTNVTATASGDVVTVNITDGDPFTNPVDINVNSTSSALTINQIGTGNALLVEDSSSPDSTPTVIDTNGNVILGKTSRQSVVSNKLEVHSTSTETVGLAPSIGLYNWNDSTVSTVGPYLTFFRYPSGTVGTTTTGNRDNDLLGSIRFNSQNGAGTNYFATINGRTNSNLVSVDLTYNAQSHTFTGAITANNPVQLSAGTAANPALTQSADTNTGIFFPAADTIAFSEGGVESVRFNSAGNVGIGTTSPGERLVVAGGNAHITNTAGSSAGIELAGNGNNAGLTSLFVGQGNDGIGYFYQRANLALVFGTNNVERARIDATGNLLVGTTTNTNSSRLVVNGTISETVSSVQYLVASQFDVGTAPNKIPLNQYLGNLAYQNASAIAGQVGFSAGTASLPSIASATDLTTGRWFPAAGVMAWSTGGTEWMRLDASGRFLLGTTTATGARMDIQSTVAGTATLLNIQNISLDSSAVTRLALGSQGGNWFIDSTRTGAQLLFIRGTTENARFTTANNQVLYQPAESAQNTSVTLTAANLQTRIITSNAAVTLTLPTGTNLEGYTSSMAVDTAFECTFIATTANAITIAANGNTTVGSLTVGGNTSGTFRFRKTAANTFTVYRVA